MDNRLVEKCVDKFLGHDLNPFELVAMSSYRARELSAGLAARVQRHGDKDTVVALREVADCPWDDTLRARTVNSYRQYSFLSDGHHPTTRI